jgi:hypothetical protein
MKAASIFMVKESTSREQNIVGTEVGELGADLSKPT